ncbi:bifunctional 2-C-methyl-D-erythritol 4-phosphate cytidylyltransferase/2-C-methyl-D-erythritol 2,4-cyclodiphosphate synthase [Methyloraptor flagellatus]|uniref:Bifunctional enzyme IspD/IspF n=1 Tax=Methyloraptor flagellatus TaxID=3162530 RepID=A0AAU7XEZ0_9HYPH
MSTPRPRIAAIIVAAGSGTRIGGTIELPKQYRAIGGEPLLRRTLRQFLTHPAVSSVTAVIHPNWAEAYQDAVAGLDGLAAPTFGGATRQDSVRAGIEALAGDPPDYVLIHDAARPFITHAVIDRILEGFAASDAVLVAVPLVDTLKKTDDARRIVDTVSRDRMWGAQTPQAFRYDLIRAAHARAVKAGRHDFTDDAAVAEWAGSTVMVVEGDPGNTKVTTAFDLDAADRRVRLEDYLRLADVRVGTGYDVHSFEPGDAVVLGNVRIPHVAKLNGHSDADVALHALTDAILGALGEGDIGSHFPPSDPQWRGADSAIFVEHAVRRVAARGGLLAHADITLIAEAPKIGPHREAMRARIAAICGITLDRVAVKATTNEKLGFVGRREGIAAIATATVRLPAL